MSRGDFNKTWLMEMPEHLPPLQAYQGISSAILDRTEHGNLVIELEPGLFKLEGTQVFCYWFGTESTIDLGIELYQQPQGLAVSVVGKNPKLRGNPPYASSLYLAILKHEFKPIRILSDEQLSDEGLGIWKRLMDEGCHISLYDRFAPGQSFKTLSSPQELDFYMKNDRSGRRYQFVLSDKKNLSETRAFFNTRRYRELAGLALDEYSE